MQRSIERCRKERRDTNGENQKKETHKTKKQGEVPYPLHGFHGVLHLQQVPIRTKHCQRTVVSAQAHQHTHTHTDQHTLTHINTHQHTKAMHVHTAAHCHTQLQWGRPRRHTLASLRLTHTQNHPKPTAAETAAKNAAFNTHPDMTTATENSR